MMSAEEIAAIQKLRKVASDVLEPKHDDIFLTRWLRARSWDVEKAEKMLRASLLWRKNNRMDTAIQDFVPTEFMKRHLPIGLCGETKDGNPIWIIPIGSYDFKGLMRSARKADVLKRIFVSMEIALAQLEKQSKKLGKPVTQLYIIGDYENFGLRQFLPAVDFLRSLAQTYNDNYPEVLQKAMILNASRLFYLAYALIRNFIDENTQKKMAMFGKDWKDVLYADVDPSQLPPTFGGTFSYENAEDNWWEVLSLPREIPSSYYMAPANITNIQDATTVTINKGEELCLNIAIQEPGTEIKWHFQTEDYDIGFGIFFQGSEGKEEIIPIERVESQLYSEQGMFMCTKAGTYEIHFDNTYSYNRSKKLNYKIETISADQLLSAGINNLLISYKGSTENTRLV